TLSRTLMAEVLIMTAVSATSARANLYRLIDQVNEESEPLTITGQRGNAVLIGEDDWRAIQESLFLAGVPGFTESIRQARTEGIEAGSETLEW
ncbi:MAG: type II toxin-antitoxin system Phd/YefM family antitoxin, partial [Propionicimonas sp.]